MKHKRQDEILRIIAEKPVKTHDELIAALSESGYSVTQATVSRDIKELGLIKAVSEDGVLRYRNPRGGETFAAENTALLSGTVTGIAPAMHTVVVKTLPGMAPGIASVIDREFSEPVLGTIAGDDTVLVIARNPEDAKKAAERLYKVFNVRRGDFNNAE